METELTPAIAVPEPDAKERLFQCSTCKRSFTRVDHLMRHVRSHTKQRPYVCPTCSKAFARIDLLKRHATNHTPGNGRKRAQKKVVRQSRAVQACEECSKTHLRCEDEKPCHRCRRKNLSCRLSTTAQEEFDAAQELDAAQDLLDLSNNIDPRSPHAEPQTAHLPTSIHHSESIVEEAIMAAPEQLPPRWDGINNMHVGQAFADVTLGTTQGPEPLPLFMEDTAMSFSEGSPCDAFMPDFLRYMPPLETSLSGYATPRAPAEHSFWDLDFSGLDFGLLDQSLMQANFHHETTAQDAPFPEQHAQNKSSDSAAADRARAFDRSVWRYEPSKTNTITAGESNLAFPDGQSESQSPAHIPPRNITSERLCYTTRDRLLALVLGNSSAENSKRIAAGFPSLELLDGTIQFFFSSPSVNAASCIHLPTFSPAQVHPMLLACIIATGSFSARDDLLQKLGLALHEVVRVAMAKAIDEDNSTIRDIQYLQMQLLLCEVGMWSGISRKMEISESFLQPPITMLRRGGWFSRSIWKRVHPAPIDEGPSLQKKWRDWVTQESWLRLVYRYFEFDRQSSMALLKPPLISYAEMKLPLPQSEALWEAPSATAWKATYLSTSATMGKRTMLFDCMEDLEHLDQCPAANTSYLYMLWGMVWEFRQLQALTSKKHFADNLLLSSRQQELTKLCEDFKLHLTSSHTQELLIVEVLLMHLHAPLDEVQTFAGIAGPDEARHAYPSIRDWATTAGARQALWNASQVLKLSEKLPHGRLQNFYAMMLYHAALVLWVYGLIKRTAGDNGHEPNPNFETQVIVLGEVEDKEVKRFVKLNRGEPAIRSSATQAIIHLRDAASVLGSVSESLRDNHAADLGTCPPLVESLVQLMEVLRSATK